MTIDARSPSEVADPAFQRLERAAQEGLVLTLFAGECAAMLAWANALTEGKNAVVRENWDLARPRDPGRPGPGR